MKKGIKLEPHAVFKKAVVGKGKNGWLTYSYPLLVDICMKHHGFDEDDAIEWVDYNICGLAVNGFNVTYRKPKVTKAK